MLPLILNPVAITIGPIEIHWYGIILGLAALMGLLMCIREGKRFGISPDFFMDLVLIGVPSAIVGARIYYVSFQWEDYQNDLMEIFKIWHGGIAIHGALIGAVIGGVIYTRMKKVNFWRIADIAAPGLIIGQMIGRWGNFINQEAHGGVVERSFLSDTLHLPNWIVTHMEITYNDVSAFFHPTFLYESIWNLLGLALLMLLRRRPFLRAGELFFSYFIWYSIGRFYIEGLRTDSLAFHGPDWLASLVNALWAPMDIVFDAGSLPDGGGNVRIAQLIGILIIITAVIMMYIRRIKGYAEDRYSDPIVIGGSNEADNGSDSAGKQKQAYSLPPTIVEQEAVQPARDQKEVQPEQDPNNAEEMDESLANQVRKRPGKPFL